MEEIKPMQLWETRSGNRAFIVQVFKPDNLAMGVHFEKSLIAMTMGYWKLSSGRYSEEYMGIHEADLVKCVGEIKMYEDGANIETSDKYVSLDYFLEFQEMVRNKFAEQDRNMAKLTSDLISNYKQ